MRLLVTGANGFLGRRVVEAFLEAGHGVRALVRPSTRIDGALWGGDVEVFRADLRGGTDLDPAFEGVKAVVHLAAQMQGDDSTILSGTIVGTERLFAAMARSTVQRLVLVSSFSVYDWRRARWSHDETTPLLAYPFAAGAYAAAKSWQERLARRGVQEHDWKLSVLRPGFLWGRGNDELDCIGQRVGRNLFVFGPSRRPPLTHVDNCADAILHVVESAASIGGTFDVLDGHRVRAGSFARALVRGKRLDLRRWPLPYRLVRLAVSSIQLASRMFFGRHGKLPSMFVPVRFDLRYKPLRFCAKRLRGLGWRPRYTFRECAQRTWGEGPAREERATAA